MNAALHIDQVVAVRTRKPAVDIFFLCFQKRAALPILSEKILSLLEISSSNQQQEQILAMMTLGVDTAHCNVCMRNYLT